MAKLRVSEGRGKLKLIYLSFVCVLGKVVTGCTVDGSGNLTGHTCNCSGVRKGESGRGPVTNKGSHKVESRMGSVAVT